MFDLPANLFTHLFYLGAHPCTFPIATDSLSQPSNQSSLYSIIELLSSLLTRLSTYSFTYSAIHPFTSLLVIYSLVRPPYYPFI